MILGKEELDRIDELKRKILYYHDILGVVRDYNEDTTAITEYDSVYQDILDYEEDCFNSFESDKEFEEYIEYLKKLIICGMEV